MTQVAVLETEKGASKPSSTKPWSGLSRLVEWLDPTTQTVLYAASLILTWYSLSTALSVYNKVLVGSKNGVFGPGHPFPAPLLMAGIQFAFQAVLAKATFATGVVPRTAGERSWGDWRRLVLPNGIITGLDIGFSNKSLVWITVSFYTMCKSTTPVFLMVFAFIWGLEKPSWRLAGVVTVISGGLVLLVAGETEFQPIGFGLVMTAACLSGLRFTLTQLLLHGHKSAGGDGHHGSAPLGGALEVLELLTPVMSVTTLVFSAAFESLWRVLPTSPYFSSLTHLCITLGIIWIGAIMAFLMVWAEYQVIKETSALTFMIAATFKEMLTVVAGVVIFGDHFGPINGVGLVVLVMGVVLFNWYKMDKLAREAAENVRAGARVSSDSCGSGGVLGTGEGSFVASMSPKTQHAAPAAFGRRHGGGRGAARGGEWAPESPASSGASRLSNGSGGAHAVVAVADEEEPAQEQVERAPLLKGGRRASIW